MIKRLLVTALMMAPLVAFAEEQKRIDVKHLWVRASAGAHHVSAAYAILENTTGVDDKLIAIHTPAAAISEIHHTTLDDAGMMDMSPVDDIFIPHGSYVKLEPGGLHMMLMRLKQPLKAGDEIPMTLTFDKAPQLTVRAPIYPITTRFEDILETQ